MIQYGDTVTGTTEDRLFFTAEEEDVVSIDLRVNNPIDNEGRIDLRRPNEDHLTYARGNAEDGNAAISLHSLPRISGDYIIDVTSSVNSDNDTLDYELSLYKGVPSEKVITYGESLTGEITRDDRYYDNYTIAGYHDTYGFEADVGDEVTVEMRPDNEIDNDAQIALFDPDGDLAKTAEYNGEDGNAVITQYGVDQYSAGEYTIVATGDQDTDLFSYEISVYEGIPIDRMISYGESLTGEITRGDRYYDNFSVKGYHDTYGLQADVGDEITIEIRPHNEIDNDAWIALYDPDGNRVEYDEHGGEDGNAVITQYGVDQYSAGEYTIVATGDQDTDLFSYEISVYEGIPIDQTISYGESLTGEITREDRYFDNFSVKGYHDTYGFETREDNVVTIEMKPHNELDNDAWIALYDPDENRVEYDEHGGKDGNAIIPNLSVDQAGTYTIVSSGDGNTDTFRYTISLSLENGTPPQEVHPSGVSQEVWSAVTSQNSPAGELTAGDLDGAVQSYQNNSPINGVSIIFQDLIDLVQWYNQQ
ncbi:hypothetical protein Huta_2148 [Halorhabdus utahensis DSM 12940]|uniref:Uncharacterized protein n=1 Tax=Halorhabdus utahensis (strain DSM 12940 / JCM 11049 / AX-2) TaxID=519442 RepID=C7NU70_HALUD|nr:hypothetical protein [Halorhabdus utahensis]ACV12315.1 hypothetical protein Huta_2148 [Halorhabdus utahensis DSM 12940]